MNAILTENFLKARKEGDYILPNGELEKNSRYTGGRNSNMIVVGSAGTCKTTSGSMPSILTGAGGSSMIISDAKSMLYDACRGELEKMGYDVIQLDYVEPSLSKHHYNPFESLDNSNDVQKMSEIIVYLRICREVLKDPFWQQSETMFLNACLGYLAENGEGIEKNIGGLNKLISAFDAEAISDNKPCEATRLFERHRSLYKRLTGKESWAYEQFKKFVGLAERTFSTILVSALSDIGSLDTHEMRTLLSHSDFDILSIGKKKTAVFINVSDTDRSKDTAINIFYTQVMDKLCRYADSLEDKRLPVPVRFILDDFGSSAKIEGFEAIISNIRSRGISVMLLFQSLAQLEQGYGAGSRTILANCATKIYMGGSDPDTAQYFSSLTNQPLEKILGMPLKTHWLIRQGEPPRFCDTVMIFDYDLERCSPHLNERD